MSNQPPLTSAQIGVAIRAFRSETCPACGIEKYRSLESFCEECLRRLPSYLCEGVSDRDRFIELFHPALAYLQQEAIDSRSHGALPPRQPEPVATGSEEAGS